MTDSDRLRAPLDLPRALRTLHLHGVAFVVVGGIAGVAHGSTSVTDDLDICYERSPANTRALLRALRELGAILQSGDARLERSLDARTLQFGDMFLFTTEAGPLDCLAAPDGTTGFDDLMRAAVPVDFAGVTTHIAALDDLIRMKRASGRTKDLIELEVLGALWDAREG